jgi:hypothetical protein
MPRNSKYFPIENILSKTLNINLYSTFLSHRFKILQIYYYCGIYVDPLLGIDRETNETTAVAVQQLRKYHIKRPARNDGSTIGSQIFYVVRSEVIT